MLTHTYLRWKFTLPTSCKYLVFLAVVDDLKWKVFSLANHAGLQYFKTGSPPTPRIFFISTGLRIILLNFCYAGIFFDILIANNSWTVAQTPINHTIFWKSVMRIYRYIYVNCFNRLKFLAEVSTNLQKFNFARQFMDHNSGR